MNASAALALALAVLCDLLRQWDQLVPGLPILLGWLLGEGDDPQDLVQDPQQVIGAAQGAGRQKCPLGVAPTVLRSLWVVEVCLELL